MSISAFFNPKFIDCIIFLKFSPAKQKKTKNANTTSFWAKTTVTLLRRYSLILFSTVFACDFVKKKKNLRTASFLAKATVTLLWHQALIFFLQFSLAMLQKRKQLHRCPELHLFGSETHVSPARDKIVESSTRKRGRGPRRQRLRIFDGIYDC